MPATSVDDLFDSAFLKRLEALSLAARQLVRGRMKAERRSTQRGSSVEFAEYRPFTTGDDWRYIDWHAFARFKHLVLKLFVEEQDLHVHMLLDCTASMDWGDPLKYDYARRVAAGLGYMSLANLDRVSVVPLGSETYGTWHPARGRDRFLPMLRWLAKCPVAAESKRLEDTVRRWLGSKPRRGLTIVISDLLGADIDDALKALDRLRHARHELAVVQVWDENEQKAGEFGEYELVDCEYQSRHPVIVDFASAREYELRVQEYQERVRSYCRQHQISILQIRTQMDLGELLLKAMLQGGFVR